MLDMDLSSLDAFACWLAVDGAPRPDVRGFLLEPPVPAIGNPGFPVAVFVDWPRDGPSSVGAFAVVASDGAVLLPTQVRVGVRTDDVRVAVVRLRRPPAVRMVSPFDDRTRAVRAVFEQPDVPLVGLGLPTVPGEDPAGSSGEPSSDALAAARLEQVAPSYLPEVPVADLTAGDGLDVGFKICQFFFNC